MSTEQERADFEAWHKREMWDGGYESGHDELYPDAYRFNERRVYKNMHTQIAWRGYQAGRAALQSQDHTTWINTLERKAEALWTAAGEDRHEAMKDLLHHARIGVQSQDREGWKEAAIAWEVCASLHRDYAKGRDPLFKTRQSDFVKHAEASREKALSPCSTEDKTDAERYRWLRNSAGFLALPYVDHGAGPEFPSGIELDAAIDHARRVEGGGE